jgi:hypothetical protein
VLGTVAGCVLDGVVAGVVVCAKAAPAPKVAPPNIANAMIFNFKAFMTIYIWLMNISIYMVLMGKESYQKQVSCIKFASDSRR